MKKSVAPLFVLIVILSCLLWSDQLVQAGTLQSSQYYTWGIGSEALHIPEGSIITDAVLTIEGAGNIIQNSGDFFYVHLLDEPGIGWKEWKDHNDQNEFMGNGVNLTPVIENGNLIYSFNAINDDGSWIWEIFEKPFQFDLLDSVVSLPSSILELIDFAGAGDSFGIGIDGDAEGYGFNQIRLDLTVRPFEQGGEEKTLSGSLFMEDFNDNTLSSWTIVDQGTNLGPSNWTVINGELVQTTHIYSNPTAPGTLRKEGTFLKCNYGADWKDYQISLKLRSLGMNDCGVMFRVSDDNNYYRFNWNYQSNYSRLVKVSGGIATLLAETAQGYVQGKDYDLMIALSGSQMRIYVDGELRLAADDNTIQSGTVGLYCWGNAPGTYFDNVTIEEGFQAVQQTQQSQIFLTEMFNNTSLSGWTVVDQGSELGPSDWSVSNGVLSQTTHIYSAPTAPSTLRKEGTYIQYDAGRDWTDYEVSCQMRSAGLNDYGFMFRVQDENNYYRFSWNNQAGYSRLIKVINGTASQLASRPEGFVLNRDYQVKVVSFGSELRVYVDNILWLSATDATFDSGTIGLYCWGNAPGTFFDNVLVTETTEVEDPGSEDPVELIPPDYSTNFNNASLSGWTVVDQGSELGPSDWSVSNGVLSQTTHIYSAPTAPSTLRKEGTYIQYNAGRGWADYEVSCQMRSAGLNDYGLMFRVQDENNYYRFSWNNLAGYSRLIKVVNGTASQLASRPEGFVLNRDYQIKVVSSGSELRVYVDNVLWLSATDATFDSGTIGLYCWGNAPGTFFDNVLVTEVQNEEPVQQTTPDLTDEFADGDLADWIVVDQGDQLGPSDWSVSNGVLSQTTHIYSAPTSPSTLHKPGTFVKYANGRGWADYQVACTLRSAGINDCGVMFRVQDDNNYYRFSWNQQVGYSRLIRVINGTATLLASHTKGFYVNQNYEIRIVAAGSQISVYVNDVLWLSASDSTFDMGSIGLYCWGNAPGTFFDNIVVQEIQ